MPTKINIIGAGIAGLSAGCYLQMKGFETRIFEMHSLPGGLCTSWKKDGYTIDGCIHWLVGSSPSDAFYNLWNELVDMKSLKFHDYDEFFRVKDEQGKEIIVYTDIDRLREEMLSKAPEDKAIIEEFTGAVKKLSKFSLRVDKAPELYNFIDRVKMIIGLLPYMGMFSKYSKLPSKEFYGRCKNPLLARAFEFAFLPDMPLFFILMTFVWLNRRSAGYPIGGSIFFSRLIEKKYLELGGKIQYHSKVSRIITEPSAKGHRAKGIELEKGEFIPADITISAGDGYNTIFKMLEGKFVDNKIRHYYEDFATFPSFILVSLGIARKFDNEPPVVAVPLKEKFVVDPTESVDYLPYRIMSYDPTMAPEGKSVILCMFKTPNYQYWEDLRRGDKKAYDAEKQRIADFVIEQLDRHLGDIKTNLEMVDVCTPATVIRYTGNWKGSYEGWLMNREAAYNGMTRTLPGLSDFYMAGHWVEPGGGVPAAMMSGRNVAQVIARKYKVR